MKDAATKGFLAQFEASRRSIQEWPAWMRDSAVVATASFPKPVESSKGIAGSQIRPPSITKRKG